MSYGVRWVQMAAIRPHRCALNPMIGNSNSRKGFLDFGTDLGALGANRGDHVYVSVLMAEHVAAYLGWSSPADVKTLQAQVERQAKRISELEGLLAERDEALGAVHLLRRSGFASEAKRGPKPKHPTAA